MIIHFLKNTSGNNVGDTARVIETSADGVYYTDALNQPAFLEWGLEGIVFTVLA